jgi:hypothetical protein
MGTNRKKAVLYGLGIGLGIALALAGMFFKDEAQKTLSGVCIGLGAGLFGMFVANLVTLLIESRHPETARAKNIETNDERNTAIRDKAGSKANKALALVLPVITIVFVFLQVDLAVTLIMCALILLQASLGIYYTGYYNKRM